MAEARKFFHRSPRYVLRPSDSRVMKFAPLRNKQRILGTEIINISRSGLAFSIPKEQAPSIGETILIEFPIPGIEEQVAWSARVVRLQQLHSQSLWDDGSHNVMVAVEFLHLPASHQKTVDRGLQAAFDYLRQEQIRLLKKRLVQLFHRSLPNLLLVGGALILLLLAMYFMTRPSESYNPRAPSAWGDREF